MTKHPKKNLSPEQYNICFLKGTEPPFSGKYYNLHDDGTYVCVSCGTPLFSSETKFDSGTGWPSFTDVVPARPDARLNDAVGQDSGRSGGEKGNVKLVDDHTLGMRRTEVQCASCGAHLGHVFDDPTSPELRRAGGPAPTGKRYCINSLALDFQEKN